MTRFSLLQALGAYVFFSSGTDETSLLAGSVSAVEGKTPLTTSAVLLNCSPADVMKDLVASVVLSRCSPADLGAGSSGTVNGAAKTLTQKRKARVEDQSFIMHVLSTCRAGRTRIEIE